MFPPLHRAAVALSAVALLAPPLIAQRNAPATYAITNAKLVPVNVVPSASLSSIEEITGRRDPTPVAADLKGLARFGFPSG